MTNVSRARHSGLNRFVSIITTIVLVIALAFIVLRVFFIESFEVVSGSMSSTLSIGDRVLSVRPSAVPGNGQIGFYFIGSLRRKDIVIFRENGQGDPLVKRVIGIPGDRVDFGPQGISIDGVPLVEDYIRPEQGFDTAGTISVPAGRLFVLGDHRRASRDSRSFGCIDFADVKGKVIMRYYPIEAVRLF